MKLVSLSESIFYSQEKDKLNNLLNNLFHNKDYFLINPKKTLLTMLDTLDSEFKQKFKSVIERMNKEQRIIHISDNVYNSLCSFISLDLCDIYFYYPNIIRNSNLCFNGCLAQQNSKSISIREIDFFCAYNDTFDIIPNETTIDDLGLYLREKIIRNTYLVEIFDPYIGEKLIQNNYNLTPTLTIIYESFKDNLKNIPKFITSQEPKFIIHTVADIITKRELEKLKYISLICYNLRRPNDFPFHPRFLKTDYRYTQWDGGFDIFDEILKRATNIKLINSISYYKKLLKDIPKC